MAVNPSDAQHLEKLAEVYRRRLQLLQLKIAEYGYSVPPEVQMEAEDVEHRLKNIADVLHPGTPHLSAEGVEKLQKYYRELDNLFATGRQQNARLTAMEERQRQARIRDYVTLAAIVVVLALQVYFYIMRGVL